MEIFINSRRGAPHHEEIILSLDANEPLIDPNNSHKITGIAKLLRNCGMRDVFDYKHGPLCGDTSIKKVHKIDHVAATENILPAVKECGFFKWNEIVHSDHRTGFVTWDAIKLFGEETDDLTKPAQRNCMLCYPDRVEKFKTYCINEFESHSLFQALDKLIHSVNKKGRWTPTHEKNYNKIVAQVTQIMLAGDEKCVNKRKHDTPWSSELMRCSQALNFWSIKI